VQIFLDAVLEKQIGECSFRASLANGHEFTAFLPKNRQFNQLNMTSLAVGMTVKVAFSPFDMSKGTIEHTEVTEDHEG